MTTTETPPTFWEFFVEVLRRNGASIETYPIRVPVEVVQQGKSAVQKWLEEEKEHQLLTQLMEDLDSASSVATLCMETEMVGEWGVLPCADCYWDAEEVDNQQPSRSSWWPWSS